MTRKTAPAHRSVLDRMPFRLVTASWPHERVTNYATDVNRYQIGLPKGIAEAFGLIDVKATGPLMHVSLMIAGLGLVAPLVVGSHFELGVIVVEIAVYLCIAVGCLRCLDIFNSRELSNGGPNLMTLVKQELIVRRELYTLCNRVSIALTLIVFALLPLLFFYRPEQQS